MRQQPTKRRQLSRPATLHGPSVGRRKTYLFAFIDTAVSVFVSFTFVRRCPPLSADGHRSLNLCVADGTDTLRAEP